MEIKLTEYAQQIGISPQAVRKAIREGRIKEGVSQGARGYLINPEIANRELNRNTNQALRRSAETINAGKAVATGAKDVQTTGLEVNYSKARAFGEQFRAKLLELEYREKAGQLIRAEDAHAAQYKVIRLFRDAVQNIPVRVVSELAAVVGDLAPDKRHEMLLILQREINHALTQLADDGPR